MYELRLCVYLLCERDVALKDISRHADDLESSLGFCTWQFFQQKNGYKASGFFLIQFALVVLLTPNDDYCKTQHNENDFTHILINIWFCGNNDTEETPDSTL